MNKDNSSKKIQESANPGPQKNARVIETGNPSGLDNMSLPRGRGEPANDPGQTEKQNQ
jgi:hypothetical protein